MAGLPADDDATALVADGSSLVALVGGDVYRSGDGRRFRRDDDGLPATPDVEATAYVRIPGTTRSYLARTDGLWVQAARHRAWRPIGGVAYPSSLALAHGALVVGGFPVVAIERP